MNTRWHKKISTVTLTVYVVIIIYIYCIAIIIISSLRYINLEQALPYTRVNCTPVRHTVFLAADTLLCVLILAKYSCCYSKSIF